MYHLVHMAHTFPQPILSFCLVSFMGDVDTGHNIEDQW